MILLAILLIPILVDLGFLIFGGRKFSIKKFLVDLAVQTVLMGIIAMCIGHQNTADTEIWNGRVTKKAREEVSCEHSYSCNCVHVSCGKNCSTTVCQTCYDHAYDVDWAVYSSIGSRLTINRISRQGVKRPPRFDAVVVGEPFSETHSYKNYVKGSPDTLFRHQGLTERFKNALPGYPKQVYDYYKLDRFVTPGFSVTDAHEWNLDLMQLNADLGSKYQVNAVVVVTKNQPDDYFYALEQQWIGGKKNDVVLVIDVDDTNKINWVNVLGWTDNKIFQVELRDDVERVGVLKRDLILGALNNNIRLNFIRKPMKDFEYLSGLIKPTTGQWIFAMVFGLILSVGMNVFLEMNDIFDEERRR